MPPALEVSANVCVVTTGRSGVREYGVKHPRSSTSRIISRTMFYIERKIGKTGHVSLTRRYVLGISGMSDKREQVRRYIPVASCTVVQNGMVQCSSHFSVFLHRDVLVCAFAPQCHFRSTGELCLIYRYQRTLLEMAWGKR